MGLHLLGQHTVCCVVFADRQRWPTVISGALHHMTGHTEKYDTMFLVVWAGAELQIVHFLYN